MQTPPQHTLQAPTTVACPVAMLDKLRAILWAVVEQQPSIAMVMVGRKIRLVATDHLLVAYETAPMSELITLGEPIRD